MRVTYGGTELLDVRVNRLTMTPEKDPTGVDTVLSRIDLDFNFQWHPFKTASHIAGGPNRPFDAAGVSIRELQPTLMFPRKIFRLFMGTDRVWQVPGVDKNNNPLDRDPGNGPEPRSVEVTEVMGDYAAMGRMVISFWVTACNNLLLSNRWTVAVDTNSAALATRVIDGWATMRADAPPTVKTVDDFRSFFFCPCPLGYRRDRVKVQVNELGTKAHYFCLDVPTLNPMGAGGADTAAIKFDGEATAGSYAAQKDYKDWINVAKGVGETINPLQGLFGVLGHAVGLGQSILPQNVANVWVKCWGGQNVPKKNLLRLAITICLDRFPNLTPISAIATQGLGESEREGRWVKVALTLLPDLSAYVGNAFDPLAMTKQANYSNTVRPTNAKGQDYTTDPSLPYIFPGDIAPVLGPNTNEADRYRNFNLPHGVRIGDQSGSRGSWVGALLSQTLQRQCEAPDSPPDAAAASDADRV